MDDDQEYLSTCIVYMYHISPDLKTGPLVESMANGLGLHYKSAAHFNIPSEARCLGYLWTMLCLSIRLGFL